MPGLVRKILIFAAADGLVLQPLAQRGQRPAQPAKIAYTDNSIGPVLKDGGIADAAGQSFEAFGIIGLLKISKHSFLISITKRQQVAQIQGKPIYVVSQVALTPLASKAEADLSIAHTQESLLTGADGHGMDESDTDGDEGDLSATVSDDVDDEDLPQATLDQISSLGDRKRKSSIAEDVMTRKGGYGRFAQKWFSRKGWTVDQRRNLGMTGSNSSLDTPVVKESKEVKTVSPGETKSSSTENNDTALRDQKAQAFAANLLPKMLRTTQILFGSSRSFFFSYEYDITRNFMNRRPTNPELPRHTQADPMFFWNRNIIQPFIDAGQSSFVLPLMQGFVGQRSFEMDPDPLKPILGLDGVEKLSMELVDLSPTGKGRDGSNYFDSSGIINASDRRTGGGNHAQKPFLLTLISRRSVKRAGLRYLRRGIDEEGNAANSVETEQILSDPSWNVSSKIHSFLQFRGSVPIFFSQSPYSFRPVPQLQHSEEFNYRALARHFKQLSNIYGSIQIVNMVEKHGNEAIVGNEYEKYVNRLNNSGGIDGAAAQWEWWDFHKICRGMKFENVSLLLEIVGKTLDKFGDTVEVDGKQLSKQTGVLRTNCMDCLDRTNVVQSACGRRALEVQLKSEGFELEDPNTNWFNTLWADNGDAISKQYASTAAMKGDFTRTRKRDFTGALKDAGISISRFYSGIVNDYFSQAAIDFLLGNVTDLVFEDFEANLISSDPAVSMQKMRQQAIDVCQKLVPSEEEELLGAWTMLTPQLANTVKSLPFEESVLLLTDAGLYSCRFDWNMEKVSSFEQVELQHITSIKYGTYITSTLSAAQTDEERNVGILISYKAGANDITRVNTRSLSTISSRTDTDLLNGTPIIGQTPQAIQASKGKPAAPVTSVLALKAPPARSAVADGNESGLSEIEQVRGICSEIQRIVLHGQVLEVGADRPGLVEHGDIISLSEARRSTGLLEQLSHSLKKLVWA